MLFQKLGTLPEIVYQMQTSTLLAMLLLQIKQSISEAVTKECFKAGQNEDARTGNRTPTVCLEGRSASR